MSNDHGSTPAAWTAVVICLVGFTIGGIGVLMGPNWIVFIVGVAVIAASMVVGKAMSAASS